MVDSQTSAPAVDTGASYRTGYAETEDTDPYEFYEQIRSSEPRWDESVRAWLVTDYEQCRYVLRHEALFEREDRYIQGSRAIRPPRAMSLMIGKEHHARHRMLTNLIGGPAAEPYRERFVRPIAEGLVDRFVHDGHAELTSQYANQLPLRVGLASLGVDPWADEAVAALRRAGEQMEKYRDDPFLADQATLAAAVDGRREIEGFLHKVIAARIADPGDDFVNIVATQGPNYLPEWDDEEILEAVSAVYAGGETRYGIRQALAACIGDADRQTRLREDAAVAPFVEEVLRVAGPVHWMGRVTMNDTTLGATQIHKGDRVLAVLAAANRDPDVYPNPTEIGQCPASGSPDHLAFGFGTRFCPGAALARLEIGEATTVLLSRCRNLQWDAQFDDKPTLHGLHVRSYTPLHVTFQSSPEQSSNRSRSVDGEYRR